MRALTRRLAFALALASAAAGACQSFSATDDPVSDAGVADAAADTAAPLGDGSIPDTYIPDAATTDAPPPNPCAVDAGLIYCESFEGSGTTCGLPWQPTNGSVARVTGAAHGGAQFCRFCAQAPMADLEQRFLFAGRSNYVLSAWVRLNKHPDASAPALITQQLFVYDEAGAELGRNGQNAQPSLTEWKQMQSTVLADASSANERIGFFPSPFANAVGDCIDIDDVTISATQP